MVINCVKLYHSWGGMAGHWGYSESVFARKVKDAASKVQSLRYKNQFDCFEENETYIMRVDGMHCEKEEFRLDQSTRWYSQKKNSSGLTYELDVPSIDQC